MRSPVEQFWNTSLQTLSQAEADGKRLFEVFCFGDSEGTANHLAELVVKRIKSTTSALLWEHEIKGKPIARVGDVSIVTNWNQTPVCVIETIDVRIVPFSEVGVEFVYDYGEGDRSMNFWHKNMWEYYSEKCCALGRTPTPEMPVVCERFRVVFP